MAEVVLKVSDKVKETFESEGIDLKEFLRRAMEAKEFELELERAASLRQTFVEAIASKSALSEEEADRWAVAFGRKIKKGRFNKLREMGVV